jgi:hypothetical protein
MGNSGLCTEIVEEGRDFSEYRVQVSEHLPSQIHVLREVLNIVTRTEQVNDIVIIMSLTLTFECQCNTGDLLQNSEHQHHQ